MTPPHFILHASQSVRIWMLKWLIFFIVTSWSALQVAASTHICVHDKWCKLSNVCMHTDGMWEYSYTSGHIPNFSRVSLKAVNDLEDQNLFRYKISRSPDPNTRIYDKGVHVQSILYHRRNRGHQLGDNVVSVHRLALLFNITLSDLRPILDYPSPMFDLITPHPSIMDHQIKGRCVQTLLVGIGGLGYSYDLSPLFPLGVSESLNQFQADVYQRYGIISRNLAPRCCSRVVFLEKCAKTAEHPVVIRNLQELVMKFRQKFQMKRVDIVSWCGMSFKEQVSVMADTDVVFSLPGSDMMNAVFMRPGAGIVVPWRYNNHKWKASNEIRLWFRHFSKMSIVTRRPEGESNTSMFFDVDYCIGMIEEAEEMMYNPLRV